MKKVTTDRLYLEVYSDLYEFIDTINERPVNEAFVKYYGADNQSSHTEGDKKSHAFKFTGTCTWDESVRLLEGGWSEGVKLIENAGSMKGHASSFEFKTDIVGCTPCVPNAIMGLPDSMLNISEQKKQKSEVTIIYMIGAHHKINKRELAAASRKLLDAICSIERSGTRVKLIVGKCNSEGKYASKKHNIACLFPLKQADQPINLMKMSYPLVHPSFFRRQMFHWQESLPYDFGVCPDLVAGHGYTLVDNASFKQDLVKMRIIKPTDIIVNFNDLDQCYEAENVIELLKRQNKELEVA